MGYTLSGGFVINRKIPGASYRNRWTSIINKRGVPTGTPLLVYFGSAAHGPDKRHFSVDRFVGAVPLCGIMGQLRPPGGKSESPVTRVLVALDPASSVLREAQGLGCQCVVTHHPLLLRPINSIRTDSWPGSVIRQALISGIGIIAAHTNLDAAREGTNAQLKELLGLEAVGPLDAEAGSWRGLSIPRDRTCGLLPRELRSNRLPGN